MQYSKFVVDDSAWCAWDWDLEKLNLNFINSIDPGYFEYLAQIYASSDEKDEQNAALALRAAYSHGLETLFAFLFASIQAPDCVIGWVHKYEISQIRSLLQKVNTRRNILSKLKIDPISWKNISNTLLPFTLDNKEKEISIKGNYARTWEKFADEFLNSTFAFEYNSIKHGLRAKSGGFWLAIGRENKPGKPESPDKMHLMGKSEYGSTFYEVNLFDVKASDKSKRNFRLLNHSQNWQLEKFYIGLHLVSASLQNILSFLKIVNGVEPSSVEFTWPDDEEYFGELWKTSPGVSHMSMNNIILKEHIVPFSKDEILSLYKVDVKDSDEDV
jgi:hypothetical protein